MRSPVESTIALGITCVLSIMTACRHQTVTSSVANATFKPAETLSMQVDQVNTAGWERAWTNLLNVAEETFIPSRPKLLAVEVELVVGNPGQTEDELMLTILNANDEKLAVATRQVEAAASNQVRFVMPEGGVALSPGETYRLRLTGGATFGWKYVIGGYEKGHATFNGKPLLRQARSSFLFRTFGISEPRAFSNSKLFAGCLDDDDQFGLRRLESVR